MSLERDQGYAYVIKNAAGEFFTGDLVGGRPKFSARQEDAIELDYDDLHSELSADYFKDVEAVGVRS